jgi:hypothetical protein
MKFRQWSLSALLGKGGESTVLLGASEVTGRVVPGCNVGGRGIADGLPPATSVLLGDAGRIVVLLGGREVFELEVPGW